MEDKKSLLPDKDLKPFERLVAVMDVLRSPGGCAWDRKQTHESLLPYLIEEAYEVVEAVEAGDYDELREELGDLLCQVVFHAQVAKESGRFSIDDSVTAIVDKLIARHPHVFGERADLSPGQVRDQWEQGKIESGEKKAVLSGVPKSMPALTMAFRVGEKAGGVGFDWQDAADVLDKLNEEIAEIRAAIRNRDQAGVTEEIGDLLFATASLARKLEVDPERALKKALDKFSKRFARLEDRVNNSGRRFKDFTLKELENIWQSIK